MSKKEKIEKSLDVLRKSIASMPSGDLKEDSEGALKFLSHVLGGNPSPTVISCQGQYIVE